MFQELLIQTREILLALYQFLWQLCELIETLPMPLNEEKNDVTYIWSITVLSLMLRLHDITHLVNNL